MKFSNILLAVFGLSTFVTALPAPVPVSGGNLDLLEKRELIEREPVGALEQRGTCPDIRVDVNVAIDAVHSLNKKYNGQGSYTKSSCRSWSLDVVAVIKILIGKIKAYPSGCSYPPVDVCVALFVKLLVAIFVQLKVFVDLGGLLGAILLLVDLVLQILLGFCGELLYIIIDLLVLISVKIKIDIALIIKGCVGLIADIYIKVLLKLLVNVGIFISL